MRHRAALGLSEQSDAVAIVVSEESGCISLAHGGSLTLKLDPQETEGELRKLLGGSARARS
jgi:diadenylate cyclase